AVGGTLTVNVGAGPPPDLLQNDTLGTPPATIQSFGAFTVNGGPVSGSVTDHSAGTGTSFAGGTLAVNANGSFSLATPTTGGSYTFQYRLHNVAGDSDATVTILVTQAPTAHDDAPKANSAPGDVYHVAFNAPLATLSQNLFNNNPDTGTGADVLGFPTATITSFGQIEQNGTLIAGGDTVTSHAAGST